MDEVHGFHLLRTGWFLMVEELREIEEKLRSMEREFRLAVLRHEFLACSMIFVRRLSG